VGKFLTSIPLDEVRPTGCWIRFAMQDDPHRKAGKPDLINR
jgi:hypothetical protein